ncbi:hypothetical protein SAMN05421847_1102 [Halpernia humi]|uniref:Glycosyltransferase 2-like domain-containing protein n=2 Tax=Halpernia humi TaxID=493375 RepID=A0A1H5W5F5_9FLAO|nr:hypothetical protein SAMN05421847_1102 [Halpernia humi]
MITTRRLKLFLELFYLKIRMKTSSKIRQQILDKKSIPVIIINYNQLFYLRQLIDFLRKREFKNIVIIDNASSYQPLLDYYDEIKNEVTVEKLKTNSGHEVFFKNKSLRKKYGQGFYFLTDADIVPNENLPQNFECVMLDYLLKYYKKVNKIGFAIDTKNIPDFFPLKEKVQSWETRFWKNEIEKDVYLAYIDTTFALYKPKYPKSIFNLIKPMEAIRLGGNFTCKHGGWYTNPNDLSDENLFYIKTANQSASWKVDEKGAHLSSEYNPFI